MTEPMSDTKIMSVVTRLGQLRRMEIVDVVTSKLLAEAMLAISQSFREVERLRIAYSDLLPERDAFQSQNTRLRRLNAELRASNTEASKEVQRVLKEKMDLQAVVDKLPKTADGVAMVPGVQLFYITYPKQCGCREIESFVPDGIEVWTGGTQLARKYGPHGPSIKYPEECYSTREAAEGKEI